MTTKRACRLFPDSFCYVCGYYIGPKQIKHRNEPCNKFFIVYEAYFGMPIDDQDKSWSPHVCCGSCRSTLEGWLHGSRRCMPFTVPQIWRKPTNHHNDCYFCMIDISSYKTGKDRRNVVYPNIPSSIAPVPHTEDLPIPRPPSLKGTLEVETSEEDDDVTSNEACSIKSPYFHNQQELMTYVRDLGHKIKCRAFDISSQSGTYCNLVAKHLSTGKGT